MRPAVPHVSAPPYWGGDDPALRLRTRRVLCPAVAGTVPAARIGRRGRSRGTRRAARPGPPAGAGSLTSLRCWTGWTPTTRCWGWSIRYAALCGHTLARAHARSGDAIAIAAYLGEGSRFDRAIADFYGAYADEVGRDFDAFTAAIADDRVTAAEEAAGGEGRRAAQRAAASPT